MMSEKKLKPCPFHNCLTCGCYDTLYTRDKDWNTRPIEDALNARIAELEGLVEVMPNEFIEIVTNFLEAQHSRVIRLKARIAELSQAVGLITTLKPTMVMDANHPLDMVREVAEHVTTRIAELEDAQRWIPVSERLPDEGHKVLVLLTDGAISIDLIYGNDFLYENWVGDITHWMPLPTPPEVQE